MSTSKVSERGRVMRVLLAPIPLNPLRLNPFGPREKSLANTMADSDLPAPLQSLIRDVTHRSKLWHSERLDVARELIAHFHDGLASGASPETLASTFGPPVQAAALIRRAKNRGRPRAWRVMAAACHGVAYLVLAILALYLLLAARAFLTTPNIARNYLAEINAPILKIPEPDRAWPLYRLAYLAQPRGPKEVLDRLPDIRVDDPLRPAALAYLKESEPVLKLVRQAAARPSLGRPLSNVGYDFESDVHSFWLAGLDDEKARAGAQAQATSFALAANPNPELITVLLPHLGTLRAFARLLTFDAREAAQSGDASRVHTDLQTIYRMAEHCRENDFLIGGLVFVAIHDVASQELSNILRDRPALLSDEQLASLAHLAARAPMTVNFDGERLAKADLLQRTYSDNGRGDGHLTAEGYRTLQKYLSIYQGVLYQQGYAGLQPIDVLMVPATSGLAPSRRELSTVFDDFYDRSQRFAATPPWKRTDADNPDTYIENLVAGPLARIRYSLISLLAPAMSKIAWAHDRSAQHRDGVLTAVAVELFRRKHGSYPNSLAEIETSLLPAIPLDIFDGLPLRYLLHDARPVIYSVGVDRKDDQGRAPEKINYTIGGPDRWMSESRAKDILNNPTQRHAIDGDWILWPLPPEPVPNPPEQE